MTGSAIPLVIIGAGPHALAIVSALVERDRRWSECITVIDPAGEWLHAWRHRFACQEIEYLRSAGVHHPHPDPHLLRLHAREHGRLDELAPPYDQPSSALFNDFCDTLLRDLGSAAEVRPERVQRVQVGRGGQVLLRTSSGGVLRAERVVVATNPVRRHVPDAATESSSRAAWCHSDDVDLRLLGSARGRRIEVVGGGLTAAQLACGAARRGATVRLLCRRPLRARSFDVEPGWLGPKHLARYGRASIVRRRRMIEAARGGGSLPPRDLAALADAAVEVCVTRDAVGTALSGSADTVWLATGGRLDATRDPMLDALRAEQPARIVGGLPCLEADLTWPGTAVHLVGGYAALELGPAARNLWGARLAAARVAAAVGR